MTSRRLGRLGIALAAALLLLACTNSEPSAGPSPVLAPPGQRPSPTATTSSSPLPQPFASVPPASPASPEPPFRADTSEDTRQSEPGPSWSVVDIRLGRQPGFDRVVFDLEQRGDAGAPGWRVGYAASATQEGSGSPVPLRGSQILSVFITGAGFPSVTGVQEYGGTPAVPAELSVVRDVRYLSVLTGEAQAYLGVDGRRPFRVFLLRGPTRVVIDVRDR